MKTAGRITMMSSGDIKLAYGIYHSVDERRSLISAWIKIYADGCSYIQIYPFHSLTSEEMKVCDWSARRKKQKQRQKKN